MKVVRSTSFGVDDQLKVVASLNDVCLVMSLYKHCEPRRFV